MASHLGFSRIGLEVSTLVNLEEYEFDIVASRAVMAGPAWPRPERDGD